MTALLAVAAGVVLLASGASAQQARFDCPLSSCWCHDTFTDADVTVNTGREYRVALNTLQQKNQTLLLDEWYAPSDTPRPGAVIIHGGGYSTGAYDGCSHARNMSSFAAVTVTH